MWIPQQLWRFRTMPFGVWTVCFHHNAWTKEDVSAFRQDLARYKHAIVSVPDAMEAYRKRNPGLMDMLVARSILVSIRLKRRLRRQST